MLIYKIFRPSEWASLQATGHSAGAPIDLADGYIHFSTAAQLEMTLAKHFRDEGNLVLLACETEAMNGLRWEPARGGDLFPHLYRELRLSDVIWTRDIARGADGHDPGDIE